MHHRVPCFCLHSHERSAISILKVLDNFVMGYHRKNVKNCESFSQHNPQIFFRSVEALK